MQNEKVIKQVIALRKELVTFANRLVVGSSISAEDIVQDVIEKVISVETDLENYNLRAYCYRACRNTFVNLNRREVKKASLNSGSQNADGEGEGISHDQAISDLLATPSAEDDYISNLPISSQMINALMQLDKNIRETFILVAVEEMSYAEAAEVLGCKATTVPSRVFRAKKQLAELLSA